jgi:acyl dehydratase
MAFDAATRRPAFDDVSVGDVLPERSFPVRRLDLVKYAGASGDFNPIHWNERFALAVGLPNVIAHGMFSMATAARVATDWAGDPGAVVSYGTKFTKPVVVPDTTGDGTGAAETASIQVSGVVGAKDDAARTVRVDLTALAAGEKVLGRAQVVLRLP